MNMAYTQNKEIKTRISLKYDSFANWQSKNPTLLTGELAIAYLGDSHTTTTPDNGTHPILFKVGPGAFNSLPWASALAADVYDWAKQENVTFANGQIKFGDKKTVTIGDYYATTEKLNALQEQVNGIVSDTDTKYTFTIGTNGDLTIQATDKAGTNVGNAITVPILTTTELNSALASYATTANLTEAKNELAGDIADVDGKVDGVAKDLSDNYAKKADYVANADLDTKVAGHGFLKAADLTDDFAAKADKSVVDAMYTNKQIDDKFSATTAAINGVDAKFADYDTSTQVNTKITNALKDYYNKTEVDDLVDDAIAHLATAMNFIGVVATLPDSANDGDVVVVVTGEGDNQSTKEYVWSDGKWVLLGDESLLGQVGKDLDLVEGKVASLEGRADGLEGAVNILNNTTIPAIQKLISDNETDIEDKYSALSGTVGGHTTSIQTNAQNIQKNAQAIEALPANITIGPEEGTSGEYVNGITGSGQTGFKFTKAHFASTLTITSAGKDNSAVPTAGTGEVVVVSEVANNGTSGQDIKAKLTKVAVATTDGATAIAEEIVGNAFNSFVANVTESGSGSAIISMTKNGNNITFNKGNIDIKDVAQTANTYVLFNCGSATEVI